MVSAWCPALGHSCPNAYMLTAQRKLGVIKLDDKHASSRAGSSLLSRICEKDTRYVCVCMCAGT